MCSLFPNRVLTWTPCNKKIRESGIAKSPLLYSLQDSNLRPTAQPTTLCYHSQTIIKRISKYASITPYYLYAIHALEFRLIGLLLFIHCALLSFYYCLLWSGTKLMLPYSELSLPYSCLHVVCHYFCNCSFLYFRQMLSQICRF